MWMNWCLSERYEANRERTVQLILRMVYRRRIRKECFYGVKSTCNVQEDEYIEVAGVRGE